MTKPTSENTAPTTKVDTAVGQDQALDSLGIVVGEIAHDFNNILSLIFGYVEMAMSEIPEGERARSDLEHVLAAGDRAKELVARILTFSNRAKLKKNRLNPRGPVLHALNYLKDRMPPSVTLKTKIDDMQVMVLANETELQQIVMNLCNNSVQAMPNTGGIIEINMEVLDESASALAGHPSLPKGGHVRLIVKDNGIGMDFDTLTNIYTPFFTTSRLQGRQEVVRAGLGLTTVYNIVTSCNGFIYVDSHPGDGTTFEIFFPILSQSQSSKVTPMEPNGRQQTRPVH
jgi:signal transduction histidine kinase